MGRRMSDPIRSVARDRAVGTYSNALDFSQRSSKPSVQQSRVADTVRISKEALEKAEQLKERGQIAPGLHYTPGRESDLTLEQVRRVFLAAIKKYHPDTVRIYPMKCGKRLQGEPGKSLKLTDPFKRSSFESLGYGSGFSLKQTPGRVNDPGSIRPDRRKR